ncbi:hypothetical protein [Clostridium rectalis]|uniref:hypothetical protein n=1 Tax=Clostridium rectalis TaxID=2040295 RepID=UPI000F63552C|nr:hypothetical protein [Clostridium rectalis]
MFKEVWNEYKISFKFLLPFILLLSVFNSIGLTTNFDNSDFFTRGGSLTKNFSVFKEIMTTNYLTILFDLFIGSLLILTILVIINSIYSKNHVRYYEIFKESKGLYLKYLVLDIITNSIFVVVSILGFWSVMAPVTILLLICLSVLLIPCEAYLVCYNTTPLEALKKGFKVGKKYSGEILILCITLGILTGLVSLIPTVKTSMIVLLLANIIKTSIYSYLYAYSINICRKESKYNKNSKLINNLT